MISSPRADSVVEAHFAGLTAAQSTRIRFLLPGDILESTLLSGKSKPRENSMMTLPLWKCRAREVCGALRAYCQYRATAPMQPAFSAILFPLSVLLKVGGFDLALGDGYQDRYLFRLMAAGVPREFVDGRSSLLCRKSPAGSADQIVIAALANLIQCLGNPQLWHHIPVVTRPLSTVDISAVEDAELRCLTITRTRLHTEDDQRTFVACGKPLAARSLCSVSHWA